MIYTSNWFNIDSEIAIDKLLKIGKYRSFYVIHRNSTYFAFNIHNNDSKYKSIIFDKNQGIILSKLSRQHYLIK